MMRNRIFRVLPLIIRRNLRFLGAMLMLKLNILLCFGIISDRPEYLTPWIYVQMVVQILDFVIWVSEVIQSKIDFKWNTCQKFVVLACNLHVINTFKMCIKFAVAHKRLF